MAIAGRMTKFRITELSGCTKPAQEGARAVFMKRDGSSDDEPAPVDPAPSFSLDWDAIKAHALDGLQKTAQELARRTGCTYEKAYVDLLERCPDIAAAVR